MLWFDEKSISNVHRVDTIRVYYVYFQRYLEKYKNILVDYFEFFYTVGVEFFWINIY